MSLSIFRSLCSFFPIAENFFGKMESCILASLAIRDGLLLLKGKSGMAILLTSISGSGHIKQSVRLLIWQDYPLLMSILKEIITIILAGFVEKLKGCSTDFLR